MGTIYRNGKVNTIIKNGKIYGFAESNGGEDVLSSSLITNNNVISGYYIDNTTGLPVADSGSFCNDFIDVSDFDYLLIHYHCTWTGNYNMWYDENQDMLESLIVLDGDINELYDIVDIPSNAKYFRLSWAQDNYFRPIVYGVNKQQSSILKGTTTPTSAQGSNGQIYLKYNNIISDLEKITNTSDNTYISINEQGNKNTKFVIKCNIHDGGSFATPIGSRKSVNNNNLVLFFKYEGSNNARYAVHNGDTAFGNVSNFFDIDITITLSNELVKIEDENGNYIEQIPTNTNDFSTYNMMLFNLGTSDSTIYGSSTACYMDLYECKIYKNNFLTRYLLPKTENNVIGLIDIFDGTFYPANGTVTGTSRSVPLSFVPITNTYLKVNNSWQNLIGSDIDDVGNTSETATPIDMSDITKVAVTSSMSYVSFDNIIVSAWDGNDQIAANGYITTPIDVTNINKLYYELETKNCWGNGSQALQDRWKVMIGLMQTPITSAVEVPFDQAGFSAGEDFAYSNTNYGTQEIDVSNLTGNYYFTFVTHGWNAMISNLRYE